MNYLAVKTVHASLALVSVTGFVVRAVIAIRADRRWTTNRALYAAPHVVDTLLVATGFYLMAAAGWNPALHHWLGFKFVLLVVYVVLGWFAMRAGQPRARRVWLFTASLVVFAWMIGVALTKNPLLTALSAY